MFALPIILLGLLSSASALVLPRHRSLAHDIVLRAPAPAEVAPRAEATAPADWTSHHLEDYETYHIRYMALDCEDKHNTTFFTSCCHPRSATNTTAISAACTPSTQALASASARYGPEDCEETSSASVPTSTAAAASATEDCEGEGETTTKAKPTATKAATSAAASATEDCEGEGETTTTTKAPATTAKAATSTAKAATTTAKAVGALGGDNTSKASSSSKAAETSSKAAATTTQAATTSKAAETTTKATSTKTSSSAAATGSSNTGGVATFFLQDGVAGACGTVHKDTDFIAAIDQDRYGNSDAKSSLCGKQVKITNPSNSKTVTVTIADDCPTCKNSNSIDLSKSAFQQIATIAEGEVDIVWEWL